MFIIFMPRRRINILFCRHSKSGTIPIRSYCISPPPNDVSTPNSVVLPRPDPPDTLSTIPVINEDSKYQSCREPRSLGYIPSHVPRCRRQQLVGTLVPSPLASYAVVSAVNIRERHPVSVDDWSPWSFHGVSGPAPPLPPPRRLQNIFFGLVRLYILLNIRSIVYTILYCSSLLGGVASE